MKTLQDLKNLIFEYESKYRGPKLEPLKISELYDLSKKKSDQQDSNSWPKKYPNADYPGVYVFLNKNKEILYIGKASFNNTLGSRISSYIRWDKSKDGCEMYHEWKQVPFYLATIRVEVTKSFEAPAIEEFLIKALEPIENKVGINKN